MALHAGQEMMDWNRFLHEWSQEALLQGFRSDSFLDLQGFSFPASSKGDPRRPTVYLSSGMHGDEPAGPHALMALLKGGFFDDRFHWLICPVLNPTGLALGTRENSDGIDLNRDYKTCQTREVEAHIAWLKSQRTPDLFLSLHEDWESSGFYYYEINLGARGPAREDLLKSVSPFFEAEPSEVIDDHEVTERGWIFHSEHPDLPEGWPEAIYLAKEGCQLSLTFETPSSTAFSDRVEAHQAAVRESVKVLEESKP